jgi:hypothetical protein
VSHALRRLSYLSRELDYLPSLLRDNPLHLPLETGRNVKLDHLRHSHPPINAGIGGKVAPSMLEVHGVI